MATNFEDLNTAISTKLNGISKIAHVQDYPVDLKQSTDPIPAYPAAVFIPTENEADFLDTATNERHYVFNIYLLVSRKAYSYHDAFDAMRNLVDDVIDAFDNDISLGGVAKMVNAVPSSWGNFEELEDALVAIVKLRCKVLFDLSS